MNKKRLGFSRKRLASGVKDRNSSEMIKLRHTAASILCKNIQNDREIIFLDEILFNQDLMPIYGYSKIGKKAYAVKRAPGEIYTIIAAITKNKFLGFQIFKSSVTAFEFGFFLISLLKSYPEIVENRNNYTLFMDNVRSHKSQVVKNFLKQLNICYSAPYSPFLNPIEEMFSTWKHNFRKLICSSDDSAVYNICLSSKSIKAEKLAGYYVHSLKYVRSSLLQENIE